MTNINAIEMLQTDPELYSYDIKTWQLLGQQLIGAETKRTYGV